jgi:hypothetical protein
MNIALPYVLSAVAGLAAAVFLAVALARRR